MGSSFFCTGEKVAQYKMVASNIVNWSALCSLFIDVFLISKGQMLMLSCRSLRLLITFTAWRRLSFLT